jgi:hypothetical protein
MERDFIRRVLKASAVMTALFGLVGSVYLGPIWALVFMMMAALSIVNLWVIEQLWTTIFLRGSRLWLFVIFFLKFATLCGLLLLVVTVTPWQTKPRSAGSLIGGFALPYAVIVLKAVGRALVEMTGPQKTQTAPDGADIATQGTANHGRTDNDTPRG